VGTLSTHVLDTSVGRAAKGVAVVLEQGGVQIGDGVTDADGRIGSIGPDRLGTGDYTLRFNHIAPCVVDAVAKHSPFHRGANRRLGEFSLRCRGRCRHYKDPISCMFLAERLHPGDLSLRLPLIS